MIELTSIGEYYHVSAENAGSASKWEEGPLRKGLYQGKRNLSLVKFDQEEINQANPDDRLIAAELVIPRDISYGDGPVSLSVAPVIGLGALPTGYVSREACVNLATRPAHHIVTVSGAECVIKLPTWVTIDMWDGHNAFLIYHEEDETQDQYIRFLAGTKLRLYYLDDDGWRAPTWIRTVKSGDVISGPICSHYYDLVELRMAIVRRWTWLDQGGVVPEMVFGYYSDWAENIRDLQDCVTEMLEDEGEAAPAFTVPTDGTPPDAGIFNQLRGYVEGTGETILTSTGTLCATQQLMTQATPFNESALMRWEATDVRAGTSTEQRQITVQDGTTRTVTLFYGHAGGWLFDKSLLAGATSAKLRLTVTEAGGETSTHVRLYGIKVTARPEGTASYASVFDDTPAGEADCAVGEPAEIALTAQALQELRAQDGFGGLGISYSNNHLVAARDAALLIS
jgi:hypothetical protein